MSRRIARYQRLQQQARSRFTPYQGQRFSGRGIVTCAGGPRYFVTVWVMLHQLRRHGCSLPVQLWYLGPEEFDDEMAALLAPLGVECIDGTTFNDIHPVRREPPSIGWQFKPYAIINSRFEEVFFIDADNVPVRDPSNLFDCSLYRKYGSLFWPDRNPLMHRADNPRLRTNIWDICGVPFRVEPAFESGQLIVDKRRCWEALQMAMHLNEHADFYYRYVWGDPDLFHMAWHMTGRRYGMNPVPCDGADWRIIYQHDPQGRLLFQHRNGDKWHISGRNVELPHFIQAAECRAALADLRRLLGAPAAE